MREAKLTTIKILSNPKYKGMTFIRDEGDDKGLMYPFVSIEELFKANLLNGQEVWILK